ncbi:GGDEF domain-containing protein [Ectothiorhodospiraceae bacterium WFHF3C12]|nr:GGDEF domain-containing protein [Ectothiorhodospiraceae bacterium WFHF3C12]
MPEDENAPADAEWKARYQAALSEAENRESELQSEVAILRRALVRLGTAAVPAAGQGELEALRASVRDEAAIDRVEGHVRKIADTLLREQRTEPRHDTTPDAASALLEVLERRCDDRDMRARARSLLRNLDRGDQPDAWEAALDLAARAARGGNGGLFGLLRRGNTRAEADETVPADTVPATVRGPLARLIDKLVRIEEAENSARRLKRRLDAELPMTELPATVEAVTDLVVDASQEEMAALQAFLHQLTGRLFDIHAFLDDSEADIAGDREDSQALDDAIRNELAGMQEQVATAGDLQGLKRSVAAQLDTITRHMDAYRRSQIQRQQATEQRISELSARLEATERQADRLRQRLLQQQARAEVDGLTQLANRQAYEDRLEYEYARWRRYGAPLSLAVMDLDRFKSINDRFGHAAGDKVLRTAARVLRSNVRETDFLARYGGEEFVLIMPETDLERAWQATEKLRTALETAPFHAGDQRLPVTLSAGVAGFGDSDSREAVFDRADRALYNAKNAGRNRVNKEDGGSAAQSS